jgi:FlaG/FlaF family flagellin (archaellin)
VSTRATSSVLGVVLLAGVAVLAAVTVGVAVHEASPAAPPRASLALEANATAGRLAVVHRGGDPLHPDRLRVRVWIDDRPLRHQPPVPFFAATGFESGPTGPFNSATDGPWTAGEAASLTLARTNEPALRAGASVRVLVYEGEHRVAALRTTA